MRAEEVELRISALYEIQVAYMLTCSVPISSPRGQALETALGHKEVALKP